MIKRVNPFMVIGILAVLLVFVFSGVQNRRASISEESSDLAKYESKARALKDLKTTWNAKKILPQLNTIVSNPAIKKKSHIKTLPNKVTLNIKNLNQHEVDTVLKKILNAPFEIKKLNIKRQSNTSIDFNMEVSK